MAMYAAVVLALCIAGVAPCPDRCSCNIEKGEVNCKKKQQVSVPTNIPDDTTRLDLSYNFITALDSDSFKGLNKLEFLHLEKNVITSIAEDSFQNLNKLKLLNLGENHMNTSQVIQSLCPRNESVLQLSSLTLSNMPSGMFTPEVLLECIGQLPNLTYLNISHNNIGRLPNGAFSQFSQLTKLDMTNTTRVDFNPRALRGMKQLEELELQNNKLLDFPRFTNRAEDPLLPFLKRLNLDHNMITKIEPNAFQGLSGLSILTLNKNHLEILCSNQFMLLHHLERIYLKDNDLKEDLIDRNAFNHSSIETINLEFNNIRFKEDLAQKLFSKVPKLQYLMLSGNDLQLAENDMFIMIRACKELIHLNLINTNLYTWDTRVVPGLPKLQRLLLDQNKIKEFKPASLAGNNSLKYLSLSKNRIEAIDHKTVHHFRKLDKLSIYANPFYCDCRLMIFRQWLSTTNVKIIQKETANSFRCELPSDLARTDLFKWGITPNECVRVGITPGCAVWSLMISTVFLAVIVGALWYKYKQHFRFYWFLLNVKLGPNQDLRKETCEYDAYVCYNDEEYSWVMDRLLVKIEDENGLRLHLHEDDWTAGVYNEDTFLENLANSRRIILVVSNDFASCQWSQLEMTNAHQWFLKQNKSSVIIIKMEEIEKNNMGVGLRQLMSSKTCIIRGRTPQEDKVFWKELREVLGIQIAPKACRSNDTKL